MDVYEDGHVNRTAENTMDKILKHKRIQHASMQRNGLTEAEKFQTTLIQKLAFYDWVGGVVMLGL